MRAELGAARVLVNCAGIPQAGNPVVTPDGAPSMEVWNRTIAVHLTGSYNMVRLAANDMARLEPADDGGRGVCILVASGAAACGRVHGEGTLRFVRQPISTSDLVCQ